MNSPLKNIFDLQIRSLKGFEFQDFIIDLFLIKYGHDGFTVLRRKKDKGCDGIINSSKEVIACYGPDKNDVKKFNKKAEEDFQDFRDNWCDKYPNWKFIINQDISPVQISKIRQLKSEAVIIGIKQIITLIEEMKYYQIRELGSLLKIDKDYFATDYLSEILEDLLKDSYMETSKIEYDARMRLDTLAKIELNYQQADIESAKQEYEMLIEEGVLVKVGEILFAYEDKEIERLKYRILYDYNHKTSGEFKQRLSQLCEFYLGKYSSENDDQYLFLVRGVLIYLFEQCLIGIKQRIDHDFSTSGE